MSDRDTCHVCGFPLANRADCDAWGSATSTNRTAGDRPSPSGSRVSEHAGPAIDWRSRALDAERGVSVLYDELRLMQQECVAAAVQIYDLTIERNELRGWLFDLVTECAKAIELAQRQADWGCDRGISGPWLWPDRNGDDAWSSKPPSGQTQRLYPTRAQAARAMRGGA